MNSVKILTQGAAIKCTGSRPQTLKRPSSECALRNRTTDMWLRGAPVLQKFGRYPEDAKVLCNNIQNSVATATCPLVFVRPWFNLWDEGSVPRRWTIDTPGRVVGRLDSCWWSPGFISQHEVRISWIPLWGFIQFLRTNAGIVSHLASRPLPFLSLPLHYLTLRYYELLTA